ncbi:bifunctional DNA-formamidopyrimidine glycosylase/DNA-(apurinic or apyrimidinic site) lyase [Rubrivivax albus]|uniref:Formamidopyrimidine-DNA glycosylase n=1 Tax=Rubrivivax albus TaxID=2499835 RepID=A0A437JZU3_9BURK|nr:bifunctional DNA-formamidopyrimidine glycosylase/DNA-(apurinic or apyrimidinic site) lyase [Rubrivivax albus]RVT53544.1 bifunctional DNA-formamidopyrimidine glycosylase/DNA-(apurinic or apyrimidinic site) lyase [Rubrivivax albus]
MPELPEVEVTRRSLDGPLQGARILGVRLGKPLRWPLGCDPAVRLIGRTIGPIARRGKYLWMPLHAAGGAPDGGLLLHLGMSGSLALQPAVPAPAGPHDHFELATTQGTLRLTDPRRFGAVVWSAALDADPARKLLSSLGHEPFDEALTPEFLHAALKRRRAPIKPVLMAGDIVVGAGNIYACEALFEAGIHPGLRADRLSRPRAARLLAAVRATLSRALALGGSTLRDFHDAHGMDGAYQDHAAVYGRAGQPCHRCGQTVRRSVQAQRATYWCPGCQKR